MTTPRVADIVHYVAYGTPGGEYPKACRAAVVTQVLDAKRVGLCVLNPSGMFFNEDISYASEEDGEYPGGSWHWPGHID